MSDARGKSFDGVAATYDSVRPGYPEALYDRIIEYGGLTPVAKVLEVSAGTGKATLPLAQRGFELHCLEPGASLTAVARARLSAYPRVSVRTTTFEEWTLEPAVELRACAALADIRFETFDWQRSLNAADYSALLSTYSDHFALPPTELGGLLAAVSEVIQRHGGTLTLAYQTGLFLARRSSAAP